MIGRLHYITQDIENTSHAQLVKEACDAGVHWIQLRVKDKTYSEWLNIAHEAKKICDANNAILIINDNVQIAQEINAHGVHLGKKDTSVKQAREILGDDFIIGATANTFDDIKDFAKEKVDYIGLGPFRFTSTKKNLSPILGLEGYKQITKQCLLHNITVPLIAIGGITANDISLIMETGMYGIAVSSYITNSKNKIETIQEVNTSLNKTYYTNA